VFLMMRSAHLAGFLRVFFHHGFDAEDGAVSG
jgi:hypothetical protein